MLKGQPKLNTAVFGIYKKASLAQNRLPHYYVEQLSLNNCLTQLINKKNPKLNKNMCSKLNNLVFYKKESWFLAKFAEKHKRARPVLQRLDSTIHQIAH